MITSSSGYSSDSSLSYSTDSEDFQLPKHEPLDRMKLRNPQGIKAVERWYCVIKIVMIVALVLFGLTIAFLGLSQAGMIPLLTPLYSFSAFVAVLLVAVAVDCKRRSVSRAHNIDPDVYDKHKYPLEAPKKESEEAKKKPPAKSQPTEKGKQKPKKTPAAKSNRSKKTAARDDKSRTPSRKKSHARS